MSPAGSFSCRSSIKASIPAPTPEEVFQRAEIAVKAHRDAARRNKKIIRMIRLSFFLILGVSVFSSFSSGFSWTAAVRPITALLVIVAANILLNEYRV